MHLDKDKQLGTERGAQTEEETPNDAGGDSLQCAAAFSFCIEVVGRTNHTMFIGYYSWLCAHRLLLVLLGDMWTSGIQPG